VKEFGRSHLADRAIAKGGEGWLKQPVFLAERSLGAALAALLIQELIGNLAEGISSGLLSDLF
jgi:hypothetical protein